MKHRSIHIFILVAAMLVAAPQASQELSDMKDALGRRLKSEIFHAFLSLQTGDGARLSPQLVGGLLASCDGAEAAAGAKRAGRQSRPAATQVEVHARREVPAEVELIGEPAFEFAEFEPELAAAAATAMSAPVHKFELHDAKVMRGRELSAIIPPDADFMAPPPPRAPRASVASARARGASARGTRRAAELERRTAVIKIDVESAIKAAGVSDEEARRQLESLRLLRVDADGGVRPLTKTLTVKRPTPKPAPAAPVARAACPKTPAPATTPVACGPTAIETFYAGE